MKPITITAAAALTATALALAANTKPDISIRYDGPYAVAQPFAIDSLDVNSKKYDPADMPLPASLNGAKAFNGTIKGLPGSDAVHYLSFDLQQPTAAKFHINRTKADASTVFVNGKAVTDSLIEVTPGTQHIVLRYFTAPGQSDDIAVGVEYDTAADTDTTDSTANAAGRLITLDDIVLGRRVLRTDVSPSGKYLLTFYSDTEPENKTSYAGVVTGIDGRKTLAVFSNAAPVWITGDTLVTVNPEGEDNADSRIDFISPTDWKVKRSVSVSGFNRPAAVAPDGSYVLWYKTIEGPAEGNKEVYEVVNPEDRQPGWRNRMLLAKTDLRTGVSQMLTFGNQNTGLIDLSADGTKAVVSVMQAVMGPRPTEVSSYYLIDTRTNKGELLIDRDGFTAEAALSPDGKLLAIKASPEALGRIGCTLPDSLIPSAYDYQLLIMDLGTKKIQPMTRDFDPSVESLEWGADGRLYFTATDRDCVRLYSLDPKSGAIVNLGVPEDLVSGFSLSRQKTPVIAYWGQGADNSDRIYTFDTAKGGRHTLVNDLSAERLDGIRLGQTHQWNYIGADGDTITARYVLPPDFDPAKRYPVIVNYYGGCSPTTRTFESRYPHHLYAANGYVVLSITPRGAYGAGQAYSAAHVNTAGKGVAEDIITGVQKFKDEMPWVDGDHIGCIGASYGGFMTQYLVTQTPMFAAAISHAGISDHTSYWGEGYWGYTYSQVSMSDSYPWSHRQLYVDQSPLYNADKITTPLLFLHGDADTNVPVGESIQLFTALKVLQRPTAMVLVKGANHHVLDYDQRQQWQRTIFAWFDKYLKNQPETWNELYPAKNL